MEGVSNIDNGAKQAESQGPFNTSVEPPNSDIPPTAPDLEADESQAGSQYGDGPTPDSNPGSYYDDVDRDSASGSLASSTTSVRSSLSESVEYHGRTYHRYKDGKYYSPNDETERDRLDSQHHLFRMTVEGKLHLAPSDPSKLHNALDLATGTGIWAIDFADQYPNTHVIGTDLSAIQPNYVPPNCEFLVDDAEDPWLFSQPFDYIHLRACLSCFNDFPLVSRHAFASLAPGGYLELQDGISPMKYVGTPPTSSSLYKWMSLVMEASQKSGRPWDRTRHYATWSREIGFEDVQERAFYWPTNPWPKDPQLKRSSSWYQEDSMGGSEAITMKSFTAFSGWSEDSCRVSIAGVRRDLRDPGIKCYIETRFVWGRKPE